MLPRTKLMSPIYINSYLWFKIVLQVGQKYVTNKLKIWKLCAKIVKYWKTTGKPIKLIIYFLPISLISTLIRDISLFYVWIGIGNIGPIYKVKCEYW